MKVTKVCCQGCGADLQVDESIRYVTCNYCNSRLEVVHDATVTHTRQLDKIEKATDRMAGNLKVIELQNDLERLDREWDNQRDSLMVRDKNGHASVPSVAGSVFGGIFAIGGGILWMIVTGSSGAPAFVPLFGFLFIGMGLYGLVNGSANATSYQNQRVDYEAKRRHLIGRLEREKRG